MQAGNVVTEAGPGRRAMRSDQRPSLPGDYAHSGSAHCVLLSDDREAVARELDEIFRWCYGAFGLYGKAWELQTAGGRVSLYFASAEDAWRFRREWARLCGATATTADAA